MEKDIIPSTDISIHDVLLWTSKINVPIQNNDHKTIMEALYWKLNSKYSSSAVTYLKS